MWSECSTKRIAIQCCNGGRAMREPTERDVKKDIVLEKCFNCMTQKGIEGISVKDFSDATGMSASSLYYWFEDKDEIVLDAVRWGLESNVNGIFDFAFKHTNDLEKLCKEIVKIAQEKKCEFRLIFQVATSPQYGEHIRQIADNLNFVYTKYTEVLSEKVKIPFEKLFPLVNFVVSSFVDCVIWEEWKKLDEALKCIVEMAMTQGARTEKKCI